MRETVKTSPSDWSALHRQFATDGVVKLPGLLDADSLKQARACFDWSLGHLGPNGSGPRFLESAGAETFEDKANPAARGVYSPWLQSAPLAEAAQKLWQDTGPVWFMYEQVFKKAGETRRTCWHQDSSYLAVEGNHLIVFWISFDPVAQSESLEFVRGSHRGPLYNGSTFNEQDPTEPIYRTGDLPRLPDVDANPAAFDIVSYPVVPGDVVAFHPQLLHGGAATHGAGWRETLSIRLFGSDAVYASRPGPCGPRVADLHESLRPGDAFRSPSFVRLTGA